MPQVPGRRPGDGHCPTCHGEGWIELLGAGVVQPAVLEMSGIDPAQVLRLRLRHGAGARRHAPLQDNDLRLIVENDVRFLYQF